MSKVHYFPGTTQVEQEASAWIARLHADDVTQEDLARFAAWRAARPRHARAYDDVAQTIEEVKRAGRLVRAVSFGNAMNAAAHDQSTPSAWRRLGRRSIGVAAALILTAVAVAGWLGHWTAGTSFQTAIGEHASVELPDGSKLDLNTNSLAHVEYSQNTRLVRLARGEAFFKVAHEPQRPFWVVAGDSWILAVGTAFNVDMSHSSVRVVVSEGMVKVATVRSHDSRPSTDVLSQAPASVLTAGQQAEVHGASAQIRAAPRVELTRVAAWRKGSLYFENQPLASVVAELGRYTSTRITIEDEKLRRMPVGGSFQANPQGVNTLLMMLERGFGLEVRREGGEILIGYRPAQ